MEKEELKKIIQGFSSSYYIYTICELNILDYLWNDAKSSDELSHLAFIDINIIDRLLCPLIAMELITFNNGKYELSNSGRILCGQSDNSLKPVALMCGREGMRLWNKFYDAIKMKKKPYEIIDRENPFILHSRDEQKYNIFDNSMKESSDKLVLDSFFKEVNINDGIKIVDIGGGSGTIIVKFLKYYRKSSGIVADLEFVNKNAMKTIIENKIEDRCNFQAIDFFKPIEILADIFILSRVLHDWDDDNAIQILTNIRNTFKYGNKLLIIEKVIPDQVETGSYEIYLDNLNVWVMCGGKERKIIEFERLLNSVGFRINKIYDLFNYKKIIEVVI